MAISFDTLQTMAHNGNTSYSITPNETPIGVVVVIGACYDQGENPEGFCTYGGVALEKVVWGQTSPGGEESQWGIYALKSGVPSGPQDLVFDYQGVPQDATQRGVIHIITGDGDSIEIVDSFARADSGTNLDSGDEEALRVAAHGNGHFQGGFSIPAGWTQSHAHDYGSMYYRAAYQNAATGSVSAAYSGGQDPLYTVGAAIVARASAKKRLLPIMVGL